MGEGESEGILPQVHGDDHQRPVGRVLEVAIPDANELGTQSFNLLVRGAELARRVHRVPAQLLVVLPDLFLDVEPAVGEGVDCLCRREARSVGVQRQMMILVVVAYARQVFNKLDSSTLKDLTVADSGSLQDKRCSVRSRREHHQPLGADGAVLLSSSSGLEFGVGPDFDANSTFVVIEYNFDNLSFAYNMQIWVVSALQFRVEESVGCILSSTVRPNIPQPTFCAVVGVEVLKVLQFTIAHFGRSVDELIFGTLGSEGTTRYVDRARIAVMFFLTSSVVRLELVDA